MHQGDILRKKSDKSQVLEILSSEPDEELIIWVSKNGNKSFLRKERIKKHWTFWYNKFEGLQLKMLE